MKDDRPYASKYCIRHPGQQVVLQQVKAINRKGDSKTFMQCPQCFMRIEVTGVSALI